MPIETIDARLAEPDRPAGLSRRRRARLQLAVAALAAMAVLVATRDDPVLSPDSITYLSAAESLRDLDGYRDFTGEPLTHFPPVFPLLLLVGGRSLLWASIVGAAGAAAVAALFAGLLSTRVRWGATVVGAVALALSQALVRTESTVWSETPYLALSLATIVSLAAPGITVRRAAAGGALAGLGFLTRYAGAGLVATGLVMVVVAGRVGGRAHVRRVALAFLAPAGGLATAWMARNLVATGEPLGPHFEGGAGESVGVLVDQVAIALGRLATDIDHVGDVTAPIGGAVLAGLAVAAAIVFRRRPVVVADVGMAVFGLTSVVLPTLSRAIAGTHIEARIMSPVLIPALYFAIVALDALARNRALIAVALTTAVVWSYHGVAAARDFPDRLGGSAGNVEQYAPELYDLVEQLPADATVLTNSPQRVWWHTGRRPTLLAFTRPTPGNSHFPLSPEETVRVACTGDAFLAWFPGLDNAGGAAPAAVRPDLAELVPPTEVAVVPGGTLYELTLATPGICP